MKSVIVSASILLLSIAGCAATALAAPASHETAKPATHSDGSVTVLPAALRPALLRALAKDAGPTYQIGTNGCATLSKPSLKACFDDRGVRFNGTGAAPLALRLLAYGRQAHLMPISATHPRIAGNRVDYVHGNLTEWWRVLPVGFEQGFTIAKRPGGLGTLTLTLAASGKASEHTGALGWGKLRYGKLVVNDAHGKVVPATLKTRGNRILIAVNDAHAAYPLTVDPLVWLQQKVTASDGGEALSGDFGYAVAISGDTALVGAPGATVNLAYGTGAVYVFTETNGSWSESQKLVAGDSAEDSYFGYSVALDGSTALIGAERDDVGGNTNQGAAYIFTRSNGSWAQTQKLVAGDGQAGDGLGYSVALSGDTALVGAAYATVYGNTFQGAAYVFTQSDGTWAQSGKLLADDGAAGDSFGISVALSGATALVGAFNAAINGNEQQGAAYFFNYANGTWTQRQKLTADDGAASDIFGRAVALSDSTALIGASNATIDGNPDQGAVYAFTNGGGTWTQSQKFTASDGTNSDSFAYAVGLDGANSLVGAAHSDVNGNHYQGAGYFYGNGNLGLNVSAPQTVGQGENYVSQTIATNNASAASPAVSATITIPAAASFVSATASQGSCGEDSGVVTCDFGAIGADGATATADVTLKATGNVGTTIENTASIANATPPLGASAPTTITAGGACPDGYTEYDGSLNAGGRTHSPIYQAPVGMENAILGGPSGFQLYAVFQNAQGRKVYRIPGNEIHRQAPAGYFTWVVKAGDTGGAYTLCVKHP